MQEQHSSLRRDSQCLWTSFFLSAAGWCWTNQMRNASVTKCFRQTVTHAAPLTRCVFKNVSYDSSPHHPPKFLLYPCRSGQRGYAYYEPCVDLKVTEDLQPWWLCSSDAIKERKVSFTHVNTPTLHLCLHIVIVWQQKILRQSENSSSESDI